MREWLNRADSKSVVLVSSTEGSNPSLSVFHCVLKTSGVSRNMRLPHIYCVFTSQEVKSIDIPVGIIGGVTEWLKVHAWKACEL